MRQRADITGVQIATIEHKVSLISDDAVFILCNPQSSFTALQTALIHFGNVCGYKINEGKSSIMGFNITPKDKHLIKGQAVRTWKSKVRYLGVKIGTAMTSTLLRELNVNILINAVRQQLRGWEILKLSWFGRIAALKMVIVPKFVFLFGSVILALSRKILNGILCIFNNFV